MVVVLFGVLRLAVLDAFRIPSGSMRPTLREGDFLFAWRLGVHHPARGDLVIFRSPLEPDRSIVKRVVAVPGDTVAMEHGVIALNGVVQEEPYTAASDEVVDPEDPQMRAWQRRYLAEGSPESYHPTLRTWGPLVIPSDSVLVLGDNRDHSYDSRYWGLLGQDRIEGRPMFIYYSYDPEIGSGLKALTATRWHRLLTRPR